jgi:hypothetical protein
MKIKRWSVFCLLLLLIINSKSQSSNNPKMEGFNQTVKTVIEDQEGNYFMVGQNYDNINSVSYGKIIKLDQNGSVLNNVSYGNTDENTIFFNILEKQDTLYLLGFASSNNLNCLLFVKMNSELEVIDDKKYPFPSHLFLQYMNSFIDSENNIVITGYNRNYNYDYNIDPFYYKLSLFGDSITSKFQDLGGNYMEFSYHIMESLDSTYYFVSMQGDCNGTLKSLVILDKNFNEISYRSFSLHGFISFCYINDSTIAICCSMMGDYNLHLITIDNMFMENLHLSFYKTPLMRENPAIHNGLSKNNNYIYLGSTSNINFSNPYYSSNDSWFHLVKFDETMNPLWEKWYGGDAYYLLYSVLATSDNGCLMIGSKFEHGLTVPERVAHYIKVDANGDVQWTQDIEMPELSYKVYPNPTQSVFNIENFELNIKQIEVYDISGRYLTSISDCNNSTISIDLTPFSNGIYFAKIKSSKGVRTEKVVKN